MGGSREMNILAQHPSCSHNKSMVSPSSIPICPSVSSASSRVHVLLQYRRKFLCCTPSMFSSACNNLYTLVFDVTWESLSTWSWETDWELGNIMSRIYWSSIDWSVIDPKKSWRKWFTSKERAIKRLHGRQTSLPLLILLCVGTGWSMVELLAQSNLKIFIEASVENSRVPHLIH